MNLPDIEPIAGNVSAQIEAAAQAAYTELLRLIEEGTEPRRAVEQALTSFNGQYVTALSEAFSVVMQTAILPPLVLTMPVGEVHLSKKLYTHLRQTQGEVAAIVRQHAQGLHNARQLALRLYDGYNPQDGIQRPLEGTARAYLPKALRELTANPGPRQSLQQLLEQMQAQAGRLKSEALKAGYMEALDAWAKGAGKEVLQKRLWVAQREKTRYMANRIAQTELARAYTDRVAHGIMQDDEIEVVQVRLNPRHPLPDICDLHAKANLWGLGPGLYPKARAPKPPFHPHCFCKLVTRPDLTLAQAKEREDGAREFLKSLPPAEAARVLGNRERLDLVLGGADWEKVTQAAVRSEYRLRRVGEVSLHMDNASMNFEDFWHGRTKREEYPIAALSEADMRLLGAQSSTVWLSRESLNTHLAKHPEVGMMDYQRIPDIIRLGEIYQQGNKRFALLYADGVLYRAAIKITADGSKVYFLTLFRTTEELASIQIRNKFERVTRKQ